MTQSMLDVLSTSTGRWGVFRALGGVVVGQVSESTIQDLVMAIEPRASTGTKKGLTEIQCQEMCVRICERVNGGINIASI